MTRRVLEKLCTKKFALIFRPLPFRHPELCDVGGISPWAAKPKDELLFRDGEEDQEDAEVEPNQISGLPAQSLSVLTEVARRPLVQPVKVFLFGSRRGQRKGPSRKSSI